jgi:hypothetical protein
MAGVHHKLGQLLGIQVRQRLAQAELTLDAQKSTKFHGDGLCFPDAERGTLSNRLRHAVGQSSTSTFLLLWKNFAPVSGRKSVKGFA